MSKHRHPGDNNRGRQIKYRICPKCGNLAVVIADIEERILYLDARNRRNYCCLTCAHRFPDEQHPMPPHVLV